jgi:D-serine deaminase-like pyridoxal phosphate-dependent protein
MASLFAPTFFSHPPSIALIDAFSKAEGRDRFLNTAEVYSSQSYFRLNHDSRYSVNAVVEKVNTHSSKQFYFH